MIGGGWEWEVEYDIILWKLSSLLPCPSPFSRQLPLTSQSLIPLRQPLTPEMSQKTQAQVGRPLHPVPAQQGRQQQTMVTEIATR